MPSWAVRFEQHAQKVNRRGHGSQGGSVDVLWLFVEFSDKSLERVSHLGDLPHAGKAGIAGKGMDFTVELVQLRDALVFRVAFDKRLKMRP